MRAAVLTLLALAAYAAAASRGSSQPILRQPLEARREYRFTYEGALVSGLPIETEGAVSRIAADVTVQMIDDRTVHMRLSSPRISASHVRPEQLKQQQKLASSESLEERTIEKEHRQLLELPIRATYRNGQVSEVQFAEEDKAWSKNIKRAVLNMLQMNVDKSQSRISSEEQRSLAGSEKEQTDSGSYTLVEKTIEGDCEVSYNVVREQSGRVVVTKSVNFDKCSNTDKTQLSYGQRFESECEACEKQSQIVNPHTLYTYIIERDQLKSVEVNSAYQVVLKNQPMMKTETTGRLTLESESAISSQISAPKGQSPKEDLIYSNEWEETVERFYKNGEKEETFPFEEYEKIKMQQVERIADKISKSDENKPETSHMLARLVQLQRMMSETELSKQHNEIYKKADEKVQDIIEHSLAIAGTHNTVKHLIEHIEKEEVSPIKAAHMLKSVAETPYPSQRIVEMLVRLAKSSTAKRSSVLRQSAWLAAGAVMRGVVGQTKDRMLVDEATKENKEEFIRICMKEFESAESTYEKVLALKTLANAGIDLSVYELIKIINDRSEKLQVRIEAVEATRLLKDTMPRKLQNILLPLYKDNRQPAELRMTALVRLMHTLPRSSVLAQIFHQMERESHMQVAAFTFRLLSEIASSSHPCFKQIAVECHQLLSSTRFVPPTDGSSSFHLPLFSEKALSGVAFNFMSIFGSDSYFPKAFTANMDSMFVGNWNKYLAQIGFSQQNTEQLIAKITRKLESQPIRGRRAEQPINFLKEMSKKLNIRTRDETSRQEPFAMFYLRYKEMDFAMLPIDEKIVDEIAEMLISNGRITPQQLSKMLNRNHEFSTHAGAYFYESIRKLPTTLGLPLMVSGKMPTVMSIEGNFELELLPLGLRMTLKAQPSIASTHVSSMKVWTPLFEQGVKVLTSAEMNTPLNVEIEGSLKGQLEINYKLSASERKPLIVRASRSPVVFMRFVKNHREYQEAEQRTLSYPFEKQLLREVNHEYETLGMSCRVNGMILTNWQQPDAALFCEQHIEFIAEPTNSHKPITGKLLIEQIERTRIEAPVEGRNLFADEFADNYKGEKETEYEYENYSPRSEHKRREHFEKRVGEWKQSSQGYKHRIVVRVEQGSRQSEVVMRTECDEQVNYCRMTIDARRPAMFENERTEWTLKAKTAIFLPRMPVSLSELEEQEHREVQAVVDAEWGCGKKSEMNIKLQFGQSPVQASWLRVYKKAQKSGMSAYDMLVRAARLNELKVVAEYKEMQPLTVVYAKRAFDLFKAANLWSTSKWTVKSDKEESRREQNGRLFVRATVEPVSRRYVNVSVETESERVEWVSMPLSYRMPLPSIARGSMRVHQISSVGSSECRVQVDRVSTFDGVPFRAPLTTCYSVLAKDCASEEPRFAVLSKKLTKRSEKLAVKIIDEEGNEYELVPEESENKPMRISYNGKQLRDEEKMNEKGIEMISNDVVRVKLTDIEIRFDGYNVKTHISGRYSSKQCGLCGHYDGERNNEFRMANDQETEDLEEFFRSFLVKGDKEECDIEEERVSKKENYKTYEKSYFNKEEDDSYEEPEEYSYSSQYNKKGGKKEYDESEEEKTVEPVKRTRVVEFSHRICFSKEAEMECPRGSQPEKTADQKVHFTCLPRQNSEARKLLKQAREGKQLRLADYPVSYVESMTVPKTCEVY